MNQWQERFAQKVELVRNASLDQFEGVAERVIIAAYKQYQQFTTQQGLQSTAPLAKGGIRTFKFSITENAYVLMTIRLAGIGQCETFCEFSIPNHAQIEPTSKRTELGEVDPAWVAARFEATLDRFIEAYVESLGTGTKKKRELIGAR